MHFPSLDPARFSPITPQDFPVNAKISCTNFPQDFPKNFPQLLSHKIFPQDFPTRFSCKNFPQDFPTRISCKIFPHNFLIFPSWILIGWLPITLFQMLNFHQSLPFLNWLFPLHPVLQDFPTRFSHKNFPTRFSHKMQDFPTRRISCKIFPQDFPTRFPSSAAFPTRFPVRFFQDFPQDFPKLDPDWLAPHHPIPNAKFPPITAFLKLAFSPPPCPTRFSHKNFPQDFPTRFSHKIFPQEFPARFSHKIFLSWILIGWLPITLFQMLNFHQSLPC